MLVLGLLFGKYHFKLNVFVKDTKSQYYDVCSWHKKKHVHNKKIASCEKIYNDSWTLMIHYGYENDFQFLSPQIKVIFGSASLCSFFPKPSFPGITKIIEYRTPLVRAPFSINTPY